MRRLAVPLLCLLSLAATACAYDRYGRYGYDDYGYHGDQWSGRFGGDLSRLDPWLEDTEEGRVIVARSLGGRFHPAAVRDLNIRFRFFADTNRDRRLTDREIRLALVRCATAGWSW
ncbi:MAG TPA: hypothetical protein VGB39_03855 [Sphingomicrobium sp.]